MRELQLRAQRLRRRRGHRNQPDGVDDVVHAMSQMVGVIGRANATAERLTWMLLGLTALTILLVLLQIADERNEAALQTNLALNAEFFNNGNNRAVVGLIEARKPILQSRGGPFNETQVSDYIGEFDPMEDAFQEGTLREHDLCDSFADSVRDTYKNPELNWYVATRKNPLFGHGLLALYKIVSHSRDPACLPS